MNRLRSQVFVGTTLFMVGFALMMTDELRAEASERSGYGFPNSGVDTILNPPVSEEEPEDAPEEELKLDIRQKFDAERERMVSELVMADVVYTLNVRAEASEDSARVGYLYRDCGGTILEQTDGWTKISSGALTGWCSNDYLVFGDDAVKMADDVGKYLVTLNSEALRVRKEPSPDAEVITLLAKGEYADFVEIIDNDWVSIEYEGELGYINTEFIDIKFHIDSGETTEQVETRAKIEEQIRKEAEEKAQKEYAEKTRKERTENRGKVSADADELKLLGALIYCEAGNQSYEGKVAVGAVVMNRVKSPAYPNSIYSVIYASGQFTPAMSGKVAAVYAGTVPDECLMAAQAAINGETTVGAATHFRRNNGHEGYVLGAHVFW